MSANQRGINYSEAYINEERQIQQRTNGRDKSVKNSSTDRNIGATIWVRFKGCNGNYALREIGKGQKAKQSVEQTVTKECGAIKTLNKYNKKEIDNARLQRKLNGTGIKRRVKVRSTNNVSSLGARIKSWFKCLSKFSFI